MQRTSGLVSTLQSHLWWVVVLFAAIILRVYNLPSLPAGFHNDEASFFYNALAIKNTGFDEDGQRWPLFLHSYIDPKPALFSYLQIPFVAAFGPTVWAARLPSVALGVISLVLLYRVLLNYEVPSRRAKIVIGLLTISPWHIMISRATQEVVLSFALGLASLLALQLALKASGQKSTSMMKLVGYLVTYALLAALAMYSYHSLKIVLPVLTFLTIMLRQFAVPKQSWGFGLGILLVIASLAGLVTLVGTAGLDRFRDISIFAKGDMYLIMNEQIMTATGHAPPLVIRFFHNKAVNTVLGLAQNYVTHFNLEFLFLRGGEPTRYVVPFHGLLFHIELVLVVIGLLVAFQKPSLTSPSGRLAWLFLGWWLVSPVPAMLTTQEVPSTIRSFWMVVPLAFFVATAIEWGVTHSVRWVRLAAFTTLVLGYGWGVSYFWHQLTVFQPLYHPWNRNLADTAMAEVLKTRYTEYETVMIGRFTGQPYVYLALAGLIPEQTLQSSYPARMQPDFQLGRYYFSADSCPLEKKPGVLFVIRENCPHPSYYRVLEEANYADGNDGYSFVVYEPSLDLEFATPSAAPR